MSVLLWEISPIYSTSSCPYDIAPELVLEGVVAAFNSPAPELVLEGFDAA